MTPAEIVATVAQGGGTVSVAQEGGREYLRIVPRALLTPTMIEQAKRNREGLLVLLGVLRGQDDVLGYAGDVLGFDGEPTADELLAGAERHGAELFIRPQGDVGIRHGDGIPDMLLLRLARAHGRLLEALKYQVGQKKKKP